MRTIAVPLVLLLVGCAAPKEDAKGPAVQVRTLYEASSKPEAGSDGKAHPMAKYIEISGYRLSEAKGSIRIKMNVVNHSIADLGELAMKIRIVAAGAKPEDPPVTEFTTKVSLGPEESKQVETSVPTKLRLYELPDWQFVRSTFLITSGS